MENPVWDANRAVLEKRWPEVLQLLLDSDIDQFDAELVQGQNNTLAVNGMQLGSRHDPIAEARALAQDVVGSQTVHCYGSGLGHLPRAALENPRLRLLSVTILNPSLFALTLQLVEQQDWLMDPRTELTLAHKDVTAKAPFLTLPPELQLACDEALPTVQSLEAELTREFTESRFTVDNTELRDRLHQNRSIVAHDDDALSLYDQHAGAVALVTGAGPTLINSLPTIKAMRAELDDLLLIAVDTSLKALQGASVVPDYVVSIDHHIRPCHLDSSGEVDTRLIYFPLVPGDTLMAWPGKRFAAVSANPLFDLLGDDKPQARLFTGGSVIHPAVDAAVRMGCRQVILAGADFGYPHQRTHAYWQDGDLGPSMRTAANCTLNGHGDRIPSDTNFNNYRVALERYVAAFPKLAFYTASLDGARIRGTRLHPRFCQ